MGCRHYKKNGLQMGGMINIHACMHNIQTCSISVACKHHRFPRFSGKQYTEESNDGVASK